MVVCAYASPYLSTEEAEAERQGHGSQTHNAIQSRSSVPWLPLLFG